MATRSRGLLIITIRGVEDVVAAKRRIFEITGVVAVNFNQLNQKMFIRYEGDETALRNINAKIKEILGGNGAESSFQPASSQ